MKMKEQIIQADFIAFDAEFSSVSSKQRFRTFDSSGAVYSKLRDTVSGALLLQLGISIFRKLPEGKTETTIYTVFTFPHKSEKRIKHKIENDCLSFLASNGFDFQRCFKDGLDFGKLSEKPNLLSELINEKKKGLFTPADCELVSKFTENEMNNIENMPYHINHSTSGHIFPRSAYESTEFGTADQTAIEKYEAFKLDPEQKVLKIEVSEKPICNYLTSPKSDFFNLIKAESLVSLSCLKSHIKLVKVVKKKLNQQVIHDDFTFKDIEHDKERISSYFDVYGLSLIFYYIILHSKPILLHNGMFDYLYIIDNFICDLPVDLREFIKLHQSLQIHIKDTKLLVQDNNHLFPQFKKTKLSYILDKIRESESIMEQILFKAPTLVSELQGLSNNLHCIPILDNEDKLHDAGYDSFITGMVYLHLENKFENHPCNILLETHLIGKRLDMKQDLEDHKQCQHFNENLACIGRSFFIHFQTHFSLIDKLVATIGESGSFKIEELNKEIVFIFYSKLKEGCKTQDVVEKINEQFKELRAVAYENRGLISDLI
jgi:hypothetical protein